MDEQRYDRPASYQLHSWARRQRSAAIADAIHRAIGVIWRFLLNRKSRQERDACAGVSRTCTP